MYVKIFNNVLKDFNILEGYFNIDRWAGNEKLGEYST